MNISILIPEGEVRDLFTPPAVIQALEKLGKLSLNSAADYEPESMKQMLKDSHICITGWGCLPFDEDILESAKNLRLIAHTGATVAGIVTDYMYNRGIKVISGNNLYAESVAEGVLAYILSALRQLPYYSQLVEKGQWRTNSSPNAGLLDKKIGLVGFGAIPRYLIPMLKPFRVEVQVYDPFISESICSEYGVSRTLSLETLFSQCDIVSNHLPLTKDTYHLIGADLLSLMPENSLFVNTARGSTVDEKALEDILQSGKISAILDVYEKEPLPPTSKLRGLDNVILMPHMGGPTRDRCQMVGLALAEDIMRMINSEPLQHEIPQEYAVKMTNDRLMK